MRLPKLEKVIENRLGLGAFYRTGKALKSINSDEAQARSP